MKRRAQGALQAIDGSSDEDEKGDRQFITALARGLDVLRCFRVNDPPLSNQELAKRTGLPRPTISRITYTLTQLGYLAYHEALGCYELGGATSVLGYVVRANFNVISRSRPAMQRLATESGFNIGLSAREEYDMTYIDVCPGSSLIGLRLNVGDKLPLFESAMGRAYMAAAPADEHAHLMNYLMRLEKSNEAAILKLLEKARSDLATYGFCISLGEWVPDIHGATIPIAAPELGAIYILSAGGPAYLLPERKLMNEVGPQLIRAANEVKSALGTLDELPHRDSAEGRSKRAGRQSKRTRAASTK